jgi:hypothetical protein
MRRIILLFVASLCAIALLPAAADAVVITNSSGEPAETVVASSEDTTWTMSGSELKCATVTTHYEVTLNLLEATLHGTSVGKGTPTLAPHVGACKMSLLQVIVDIFTITSSLLEGSGTASADLTFTITHPTLGNIMCHNAMSSSISYASSSDELAFSGAMTGTENIPPCPSKGTFSGTYVLTDEIGEPVVMH